MRHFIQPLSTPRTSLTPRLLLVSLFPLLAAGASGQLLNAPSGPTGPHTRSGDTPRAVLEGTAPFVEHYDPAKMLRLAIVLTPPHPAEEAQFLEDVQNKQSPLFHKFLSSEDWDARFSPSAADEQSVVDWATSQGFTITHRFDNHMVVDLEAPAGVIEQALHLTINSYRRIGTNGDDDHILFSNDRDPVLPSNIGDHIQYIEGLNAFERMQPAVAHGRYVPRPDYVPGPAYAVLESARGDASPNTSAAPSQSSSARSTPLISPDQSDASSPGSSPNPDFYYPSDIWSAAGYDYLALMNQGHCCNPNNDADNSPPETSIAIAAYGDVSLSDVSTFQSGFPYLAWNVQKISIDGGPGDCVNTPKLSDACAETTLDTEWSIATSNSRGTSATTSRIYVYEGGSTVSVYNQMLADKHAKVFSTSWSCSEGDGCSTDYLTSTDTILGMMVGQGWTLVGDSGDQGATGNCDDSLVVRFPASDPNVVGAGGSLIQLSDPVTEVAWTGSTSAGSCSSNEGGSTGGFSVFKTPSYQSGMNLKTRAVPDLALNAAVGQNVYYYGAWRGYGGTSIVAPELAGFFAQENSYLLSLGNICGSNNDSSCAPMGNPNYAIYLEAKDHDAAHIPFYDITSGCNTNDITAMDPDLVAYCAKTGFDEVTGWGSANMLQLAWAINWQNVPANGVPSTSFSGPTTNQWYNTNQNVSWTIDDYAGGNYKPTGIAGFTQGWDSIPPDATTEPRGSNSIVNSFYSGPQYRNVKTGCLALASGESCSGGVSQGCHTAHVRGWNNQGVSTGDTTYGPICYDTVAPTVVFNTNPVADSGVFVKTSEKVTLAATDPGGSGASGIAKTYYGNVFCLPTQLSLCTTYTGAFTVANEGSTKVNYFTQDKAGNFSPLNTFVLDIDLTPPVTKMGVSGTLVGNIWESAVKVTLTATDGGSGVKSTFYSLDGGVSTPYTGSFEVSTPRLHSVNFYSTDNAGNIEATNIGTFTIASPVSTSLSVTPVTPVVGAVVTLKATIMPALAGGTPSGTVTFYNGAASIGTATLSGSVATFTTSSLPAGTDTLTAAYSGATYYLGSTSAAVTVTVNASAAISITPSTLSFAPTPVGTTTAVQMVTIKNTGTNPIMFSQASFITGPNATSFIKTQGTCPNPLPAGQSCTNSVDFDPTASGPLTATLSIFDGTAGSPHLVTLSGTGTSTGPTISITPSLTFASTPLGTTTAAQLVTIQNTGTSAITFSTASTIGGVNPLSFIKSASTCPDPLPAGASCTNSIEFDPTVAGALSATLTIYDNAGGPHTVALTGTGASSALSISITPSLTFASTPVGTTTAAQLVTIQNTGSSAITFSTASAIGGVNPLSFIKSGSTCPDPLPAGASCTNSIEFDPHLAGSLSGTLTIYDNAGGPHTVALAGTGH